MHSRLHPLSLAIQFVPARRSSESKVLDLANSLGATLAPSRRASIGIGASLLE